MEAIVSDFISLLIFAVIAVPSSVAIVEIFHKLQITKGEHSG